MSGRAQLVQALVRLPGPIRIHEVMKLPGAERHALLLDFAAWAHGGQLPPDEAWRVWLIGAGRGFGKTRAGAEWVAALARANPGAAIALVGASLKEVRRVMIEGPAGLCAVVGSPGTELEFAL